MNETILQLEKQAAALREEMKAAITAAHKSKASAEAATDDAEKKKHGDERARHLAAFDQAEAKLKDANADLSRATRMRDADAEAERHAEGERTKPAAGTPNLGVRLANPTTGTANGSGTRRDRNFRMHSGRLKAFKGEGAKERAYQAGLLVAATLFGHAGCRAEYESQYGEISASMSTGSNSAGGIFVPEVVETSIIELVEDFGVFRRYAEMVRMGSDTQTEPRWTAGLTSYFVSEGAAPSQSDPSWDKVGLTAKNLACFGKMSRNLNEDAIIDLGDKWAMAAAVSFAEKEDDCGFNGDGTSTYGGMTGLRTKLVDAANAASLHTATGEATLAALGVGTFESVMGKLSEYPGITPAWFCHKSVYHASMGRLKRTAGGVTAGEMAAGSPKEYGGYPVVFCQKMPKASAVTTGVTGIIFGDLSMSSKFGERRGRTFETGLDGNDFSKQMISLLSTQRFDINNHTVVDPRTSTDAGPVVGLKLG